MEMYFKENEEPLSELEKQQLLNKNELDAMLEEELQKPDVLDCLNSIDLIQSKSIRKDSIKRRNKDEDAAFRFAGFIPAERRSSSRLAKIPPAYSLKDDIDDLEEMDEKIRGAIRKSTKFSSFTKPPEKSFGHTLVVRSTRKSAPPVTMSVDEVTNKYLSKVCFKGSEKVHSYQGTSCHQCRQKTMDSKTVCRNPSCIGVRGQFCGICLKNRYGEDAIVVLKDPNWSCPPCRKICNCSICRCRVGKRPTGILTPIVKKAGHTNVKDFLFSLNDDEDPDLFKTPVEDNCSVKKELLKDALKRLETKEDPLLGFDKSGAAIYQGLNFFAENDLIGFQSGFPIYKHPPS